MIISKQLQNHSKQRSTSSEDKNNEVTSEVNKNVNESEKKGKGYKLAYLNEDEESKVGSDKKVLKLKAGMLKLNKIPNKVDTS